MQTLERIAAVLILPAVAYLGAACERTDTPTEAPPPAPTFQGSLTGISTVTLASGPDWGGQLVCLNAASPPLCPDGATKYGFLGVGLWAAPRLLGGEWIWLNGVTGETSPAELATASFSKIVHLDGTPISGEICLAADDYAEVLVNGFIIGTVGSTTDFAKAQAAQNVCTPFNVPLFILGPGPNEITVRGGNGPKSFSLACASKEHCTYQENPAGVMFEGTLVVQAVVGPPATLALSPAIAVNPVFAQHCVTATVRDAALKPVPGVTVRFSTGLPGGEPGGGTGTTDANGQATFCYTAITPGIDRIHAFADVNDDGVQDPDPTTEPSGDAVKAWIPPASTFLCEVTITDGGWIIAGNMDRASFGGSAKVLADGTLQGQQKYQDHGPAQPMNVHSTEITATTCSDDRTMASIFGKATIDGAGSHVFKIDVTDLGAGGSSDTYGILLDTGYQSGQQPLGGGNITIHKN